MLDNTTFYFATTRKLVAAFGTLFNNIYVSRKNSSNVEVKKIKIPLAYSPRQKFIVRLNEELTSPNIQTTLPRLSFDIENFSYDPQRQINPLNRILTKHSSDANLMIRQMNGVPWDLTFTLNIFAKNIDDILQITEQIIPWFSPAFNVTIKDVPALNITRDVPFILDSISPTDNYEGDFNDDLRLINFSLSFTAKAYYYMPIRDISVIKSILINFLRTSDASNINPEDLYETLGLTVNPITANIDDTWTVTQTITPGINT